jgi:hypothetical protein
MSTPRPVLVVYKEIVPGDVRKLRGASNDAPTGQGAKDLRFPWRAFRPVMRELFTEDATGRGGREIRKARVLYVDNAGQPQYTELEYWPPTPSRPTEDRIARVHASPALGGQMPAPDRGRVFVLLIRFDDGTIRCSYAYSDELSRPGVWAEELRTAVLECAIATDTVNLGRDSGLRPILGYYNFINGTRYCHAD